MGTKRMKAYRGYRTIEGYPTERTPDKYSYSYTRFCIFNDGFKEGDHVVWSDRLSSQYDIFNECLEKVFHTRGQNFSRREPKEIQYFLSLLFGNNIVLTGIEEECNAGNGYPYWIFYFRDPKDSDEDKALSEELMSFLSANEDKVTEEESIIDEINRIFDSISA